MPIFSPLQTKQQIVDLVDSGHFEEVARLKDELAGGLRSALMNLEVPEDFPVDGPAPDTPYRNEVIRESKNELQTEIESMIENPDEPLVGKDVIHSAYLNANLVHTRNNYKPSYSP